MNRLYSKKWIPDVPGMTKDINCHKTSSLPLLQSCRGKFRRNGGVPRSAFIFIALLLLMLHPLSLRAAEFPRHDLTVSLDPENHRLSATDTITLSRDFPREFTFALHAGLQPSSSDPDVHIEKKSNEQGAVPLELFKVSLPKGTNTFAVRYAGTIYHPLIISKNQARGFDQTPGSIAAEGVYLAATSAWYPLLGTDFITFALTIDLPAGWDAVSQGSRVAHGKIKTGMRAGWDSPEPQEEIYLIASRFSRYQKTSDKVEAMVFLREPDEGLAGKYLDATNRYIAMYDKLIGAYPYKKFALVENFWETGFGMPSFTLLGPTVLRLPFIINTSYPHEILHNWWGNSVYPVYEKGNWSEGLTAYLADHLLKEQQGAGAEYRLTTLQKYADYVSSGRDFPLTRFTSRHSASTEAVGYGKALMFFHMLRRDLGDGTFVAALRNFYQNYKFRYAAFPDLQRSFEAASGKDLQAGFEQWVTKTGAPEIRLGEVTSRSAGRGTKDVTKQDNSYVIRGKIRQVQQGQPYRLRIPIAVTLEGRDKAFETIVEMYEKEKEVVLSVPSRPLRLDIDPEFDIFRRLDRDELPPAISQALGAKKMLVVLPSAADKELRKAYETFAESLSQSGPDEVEMKYDRRIKKLPDDRAVVILGWENGFLEKALPAWSAYEFSLTKKNVRIGKTEITRENHAVVLTARNPENKNTAFMFIAAHGAPSLPGLARKLPHYHKYSYLVFEGDEPANVAKGRWQVVDSPLTAFFQDKDGKRSRVEIGKLAPREALASLPPVYSEERMMETVAFLSGEQMKGREIGTPEIDRAAGYIAGKFKQAGAMPGGENGTYFQTWKDPARGIAIKNVISVLPGKKPELSGQSVVVGAHYDHLGLGMTIGRSEDKGKIHPGADDNASGVAVLLEVGKTLKESLTPERSIVLIAFTGEEEDKLGSQYFVGNEKQYPVSKCIGMVNLDTVGRLGKKKLLVLGAGSAKEWVHVFRGAGFVTGVDIEMVAQELDSSDQKSFQEAGVPAVQLFSGPHLDYHRPTDTADKIDPAGLVKVASVTKEVVEYLANREQPLNSTLKPGEKTSKAAPKTERKVSLGTIPDFAYQGKGVRLSGVVKGSPAEAAGLKEGDVIVRIDSTPVTGLKDFSDILKKLKPGDKVSITFMRDGNESTAEAEVTGR